MKIKSLIALLLVLLICLPFAAGCAESGDENTDTTSLTKDNSNLDMTASVIQVDPDSDLFEGKDDVFNILLLGVDEINDWGTTDMIMLLSVSKANKKLKLTSIMEDTEVNIPGHRIDKLKYAYSLGGIELMVDTIRQNYSVDIHRYALVNYFTFEDAVDIFGGVELELTKEDVSYINGLMEASGESDLISEAEGKITLSGLQTLCYVRNCGGEVNGKVYEGDDFTRSEKQTAFFEAVVKKLSESGVTELGTFASKILPLLNSDLTMDEMKLFYSNIRTYVDYSIESTAVPSEDCFEYSDDENSMICITDWTKVRTDLNAFIYN